MTHVNPLMDYYSQNTNSEETISTEAGAADALNTLGVNLPGLIKMLVRGYGKFKDSTGFFEYRKAKIIFF